MEHALQEGFPITLNVEYSHGDACGRAQVRPTPFFHLADFHMRSDKVEIL